MLSDVRVIDLSRTVAAPSGAQMLGDLGADVIKVERPGTGDEARAIGPTFLRGSDGGPTREGSMFLVANRNKRGITADLSTPGGQDVVRRLALQSDVLIENYKVGDLARFNLDHASLREINPGLIYCSVTGYGQTGPYADRPGYDPIFQALGGWMSVNGASDDRPTVVASNPVDTITGYHVAIAILAALHHREKTGEGQFVDVALLDVAIAAYGHRATDYLLTGKQPQRRGTRGQLFACSDGRILLAVANKDQWVRFCEALGLSELAHDPRYDSHAARLRNAAEVYPIIERKVATFTIDDLGARLEAAGLPFAPVLDYPAVFADPQVAARDMLIETPHPLSGVMPMVANPIKFGSTPIERYQAPPLLGEHRDEILKDLLGYSDEEIAAMAQAGAI